MKTLKQILRYLLLVIFLVLASMGIGLNFTERFRFQHKETTVEMTQRKDDADETDNREDQKIP